MTYMYIQAMFKKALLGARLAALGVRH